MKANQKFVTSDEAVSPVIGVILMVAITVVLAAVVFVLVSDLGDTGDAAEQASVAVESNAVNAFTVLLVTEGDNAPYDNNEVQVTAGGLACADPIDTDITAGESWTITSSDGTCGSAIVSGADTTVVVTLAGTVVFNGQVAID